MVGKWKLIVDKVSELVKLIRDPQERIDDLLWEKLHQLLHVFMNIWILLVDQLNQILPPERRSFVDDFEGRKFDQLFHILDNMWALLVEKFDLVVPPEKRSLEMIENFLWEKNVQHFNILKSRWELLVERISSALPSETRSEIVGEWVRVGLTALVVVLLCVYCCRSKKRGHGAGKMMKAPGGKGAVMGRDSFEDNPKDYFRNLHAQKKKK
ncbi:uncharacterized protein A4U43_C08F20760 [Asparagus officinalis]|uniref:uncharacterized protein LOC109822752 n=1 Tax=Asparagus officinalis TaxID=4686 RepID=UPI00098E5FF4|nr:uncharacterized protein LOC109822752 [Asparagus officinalis]ONK60631.1 uncharacterized protein A4U43_C08F20760 [Asparagus officinalis]